MQYDWAGVRTRRIRRFKQASLTLLSMLMLYWVSLHIR